MKRCPECRRDYFDETLLYCLDDGGRLVEGPAEAVTAIQTGIPTEEPTQVLGRPAKRDARLTTSSKSSLIAGAIGILLVTALGVGSYLYYGRARADVIGSIAVMPFENQSGNPDVDYLSEGMTETLINTLTQLPNLTVKPRSSVIRFKESDAKTIGKELNVRAVLNGRLIQRGDEVTLFLSLIDTADEKNIWGKQYTRNLLNLVTLQTEIVRDVTDSLKSKLTGSVEQDLARGETTNPEAYRLYLQGRFFWNKRRIAENGKAIDYFRQAIALDPAYAKAHAGLADAIAQPSDVIPYSEREELAKEAVRKALSLNPDLAEAHAALAHILIRYDLDFAGAERELRRALELDRKWVDTYQRYCELYTWLGRHEEAAAKCREGLEVEPFSLPLNTTYGAAMFAARRYDEAIAQLNRALEMDANYRGAHIVIANVYSARGMYAESVRHRAISFELAGGQFAVFADRFLDAFEKGGYRAVLQAEYDRLVASERSFDRTPYYAEAYVLAALGDKEKAFAALNKSVEAQENPALVALKIDPRFDPLRDDPRFADLLRRLRFPD